MDTELKKNIEKKIEILEKKAFDSGLSLSDESKRLLEYEILSKADQKNRRRLFTWIPIFAMLLSIMSFFGYDNIKVSILRKISVEEIKQNVLKKADEQISRILSEIETRQRRTDEQMSEILSTAKIQQKEAEELFEKAQERFWKMKQLSIESNAIIESLPPAQRTLVKNKTQNEYFSMFGLNQTTVALLLSELLINYNYDIFEPLTEKNIINLHNKLGLKTVDYIHPLTCLMLSVYGLSKNDHIRNELKNGQFHDESKLVDIFSTSEVEDKYYILTILNNDSHKYHKFLFKVLQMVGINKNEFRKALNKE